MLRVGYQLGICLVVLGMATSLQAQEADFEEIKVQADDAYRQRDFPTAIQLTNQVLQALPEDHVAYYLRGSSRVEMGIATGNADLVREGIADSREALKFEGAGKPEYYLPYLFGMSHLASLEGKPAHARTSRTVADSLLERTDLDAKQKANLTYQRAQANLQLKDVTAAELDAREAIKTDPTHLASYLLLADIAAEHKSVPEAVEAYTRVVQQFPENPLVYNNRGMYLQSQGRAADAVCGPV